MDADEPSTLVPSTQANTTATGSARTSFSFEYAGEGEAAVEGEAAFTAVRASAASATLQPHGQQPMSLQQFHQQRLAAGGRSW
jgi:hypothetical protein